MSEMIERVARALAQRYIDRGNARFQGSSHKRWEDMPKSYTDDFYADARAAIEAMQPTITDNDLANLFSNAAHKMAVAYIKRERAGASASMNGADEYFALELVRIARTALLSENSEKPTA